MNTHSEARGHLPISGPVSGDAPGPAALTRGFLHMSVAGHPKNAWGWRRLRSKLERGGIVCGGLKIHDGQQFHAVMWFGGESGGDKAMLGDEVEKLVLQEFPGAQCVHVVDGVVGGQFDHEAGIAGRKLVVFGQVKDIFSDVNRSVFGAPAVARFGDVHGGGPSVVEAASVGEG